MNNSDWYKSTASDKRGNYLFVTDDDGANPINVNTDKELFFNKLYLCEFSIIGVPVTGNDLPTQTHNDLVIQQIPNLRIGNWIHGDSQSSNRLPLVLDSAVTHTIYNPPRFISETSVERITSFTLNLLNPDGSDATYNSCTFLFYCSN